MLTGGFGEYVSRYCADRGYVIPTGCFAVKGCYIPHGDHERLMQEAGLNAESLAKDIIRRRKGDISCE